MNSTNNNATPQPQEQHQFINGDDEDINYITPLKKSTHKVDGIVNLESIEKVPKEEIKINVVAPIVQIKTPEIDPSPINAEKLEFVKTPPAIVQIPIKEIDSKTTINIKDISDAVENKKEANIQQEYDIEVINHNNQINRNFLSPTHQNTSQSQPQPNAAKDETSSQTQSQIEQKDPEKVYRTSSFDGQPKQVIKGKSVLLKEEPIAPILNSPIEEPVIEKKKKKKKKKEIEKKQEVVTNQCCCCII